MRASARAALARRSGRAVGEACQNLSTKGVLLLDQALPEDAIVRNTVFEPPAHPPQADAHDHGETEREDWPPGLGERQKRLQPARGALW